MLIRAIPFACAAVLAVWGVASAHPPPPTAEQLAALAPYLPTAVPATPAVRAGQAIEEGIVDTRTDARVRLDPVRDNRGLPWFARHGTAVWGRATEGLVLTALDGKVLDRVPGATDVRETADGAVRAYRFADDWRITTLTGTRRLLGPLAFPSLSPDGHYFSFEVLVARTREVHVFDLLTGEEIDVARGLGRCHCTSPDGYGFPEWATSGAVLSFRDPGDFSAPPEEPDVAASFLYDLATRHTERLAAALPASQASRLPRCGSVSSLWSIDGVHRIDYARTCSLPRLDGSAPSAGAR